YGWQLNLYILYSDADGYLTASELWSKTRKVVPDFQIPPGHATEPEVARNKIAVYQNVRDFADRVKKTVSTIYGALGNCILPVLYALLGACAYLLRTIEEDFKKRRNGSSLLLDSSRVCWISNGSLASDGLCHF